MPSNIKDTRASRKKSINTFLQLEILTNYVNELLVVSNVHIFLSLKNHIRERTIKIYHNLKFPTVLKENIYIYEYTYLPIRYDTR